MRAVQPHGHKKGLLHGGGGLQPLDSQIAREHIAKLVIRIVFLSQEEEGGDKAACEVRPSAAKRLQEILHV